VKKNESAIYREHILNRYKYSVVKSIEEERPPSRDLQNFYTKMKKKKKTQRYNTHKHNIKIELMLANSINQAD